MVRYWKHGEGVKAKVTTDKTGAYVMMMEGEKYPFPGFPRGVMLFGGLSKLKHEIKNQIFNESWEILEKGEDPIPHIKRLLREGIKVKDLSPIGRTYEGGEDVYEVCKYDMLPFVKMSPAVKEIWRAFEKVEHHDPAIKKLKEILCFILNEDDGYRFRVQWLFQFFPLIKLFSRDYAKYFKKGLELMEHAEVIGDMRERIGLLRRILLKCLEDPKIRSLFNEFMKNLDWKKVRLSKADKYFFRGKYFRVDYPIIKY